MANNRASDSLISLFMSGWNNDAVNVAGSLAGGASAVLLALVLGLA